MKITRQLYCQYLLSTQINYTGTNLADHTEGLDHNSVYRFLKHEKLTPSLVWEKVKSLLVQSPDGCLLFDDTVLDKNYSHDIRGVRRPYSGNAHGIVKGIGVVNLVYLNPHTEQYFVLDFRVFDPDRDGKSKLDHVNEVLDSVALRQRGLARHCLPHRTDGQLVRHHADHDPSDQNGQTFLLPA